MIVLVVALIVFGPEKLPEIARTVGRTANQLKRMASDVKDEFQSGIDMTDDDEPRSKSPVAGALPTAATGAAGSASSKEERASSGDNDAVEHDLARLNSDAKVEAPTTSKSSSLRGRPLEDPSPDADSTDQDHNR